MTYEEVLQALEQYKTLGSVYGLEGITRLMNALDRPDRALKVIHVAGTNGKGSTDTTLATILETCGIHTATYTSPEVTTYLDRFRIGLTPATENNFIRAFERVETACQHIVADGFPHPTIFEMELAIAFVLACHCGAEVMVQETGLGGRLDATNIVEHPILVVFTAIGMDHTQFLGDTIQEITIEKAGIIKPGAPVVAYDNGLAVNQIIKEVATLNKVPCRFASTEMCEVTERNLDGQTIIYDGKSYHYPLIGTHQVRNFSLIMNAVDALREEGWNLPIEKVQQAMHKIRWPGRFEVVCKRPVIVLDGAHNPQAAQALADTVTTWFSGRKVHFLMHIFKDKDALGILESIAPVCAHLTLTTISDERSENPEVLKQTAALFLPEEAISVEADFDTALLLTLEGLADDDILIICGSLSHLEESRRVLAQLERIQLSW